MSKFQDNMRRQRENPETKRAGLKWDDEEDEKVINMAKEGKSFDDIAKEFFRSSASIKTRVLNHVFKLLRATPSMNTEDREGLLKDFQLVEEDIQKYMEKRRNNDEKKQNETLAIINKNKNNTNPTIKDLYEINREVLIVLNDLRSTLNKDYLAPCDKYAMLGAN